MEVCENKLTLNTSLVASCTDETEPLSPSSPQPAQSTEQQSDQQPALFAKHLQMKLKSHLEDSSSSSSEEYFTNSDNTTNSSSEIFYDFDDVVYDEELTSDYGTGGSNTIVDDDRGVISGSSSGSSSVVCGEQKDDDDVEEEKSGTRVRYQRSSSLKSGKTPPGTPMKKIVRFADAMGLDLIDIKMFVDEIPRVPQEAYKDLHIPDYSGPTASPPTNLCNADPFADKSFSLSFARNSSLNFVPLFHQPSSMPDFFDKIRDQKVLLENAYLTQETVTNTQTNALTSKHVIKGTVRVMNLDFHKSVYVRYTYNDWKDFTDFQATYMPGSCDGFSDRFEFKIEIDETRLPPPYVRDDAKISFACRFHCQGSQFWDNNQSRNYVFQNIPLQRPTHTQNNNTYGFFSSSSRYSSFDDFDYEEKELSKVKPPPPVPATVPELIPAVVNKEIYTKEPEVVETTNNRGGGNHMTASLYSPTGFYESAYGCYNQYGSACFY